MQAIILYFFSLVSLCTGYSYYLTVERPVVQYANAKYVPFINVTSRRYGRRSPLYYADMHVTSAIQVDNSVVFDIYFFEFVHNQYRRSFLEMHYKWCNLFLKDAFIGTALRRVLPPKCPHPAGSYHLYNMTLNVAAIPGSFPFTQGRLLINASLAHVPLVCAYADIQLKKHKPAKT